jgi:transposase-like protein
MNETKTTKRRLQFSAEDRRQWIEQYERSGQSVRDFCRDNPLCQSSLSRWLRQRRAATDKLYQKGSLVED